MRFTYSRSFEYVLTLDIQETKNPKILSLPKYKTNWFPFSGGYQMRLDAGYQVRRHNLNLGIKEKIEREQISAV